jgi:hypothetical protein
MAANDRSGSITAGGTAQTIAAANGSRSFLFVQNISDTTMWLDFGVDAVADEPSIRLVAGASFSADGRDVPTGAASIICATTGKKFSAREGG